MPEAICPHCSGTGKLGDSDTGGIEYLRRVVRDMGGSLLPGDRVREPVAAALLDRQPETLRGWRKGLSPDEAPLPYVKDLRGGVTYRLEVLAKWVVETGGNR